MECNFTQNYKKLNIFFEVFDMAFTLECFYYIIAANHDQEST